MERKSNQTFSQFTSHQIVCIEGKTAFLYSEVIQVIVQRQLCWARPLLLAKFNDASIAPLANLPTTEQIIDLREGSDLLLPLSLFRAALDTEIIPLITQLNSIDSSLKDKQIASKQLNGFIHQVWQANFNSDR